MSERCAVKKRFTAVYRKAGKWYLAEILEVPGVFTQGRTLREARSNLREALKLMLQAEEEFPELPARGKEVLRETVSIAR